MYHDDGDGGDGDAGADAKLKMIVAFITFKRQHTPARMRACMASPPLKEGEGD